MKQAMNFTHETVTRHINELLIATPTYLLLLISAMFEHCVLRIILHMHARVTVTLTLAYRMQAVTFGRALLT